MITTLLLILVALSLFSYIYDGIILPSIRMNLRFELFKLRDEVRTVSLEHKKEIDREVHLLQDNINIAVNLLHQLNVDFLFKAQRVFEENRSLQKKVSERVTLIEECSVEDIRRIKKRVTKVVRYAFFANSGSLFLFLLPAIITFALMSQLKYLIKEIVSTPEHEMIKIFPNTA